MPRAQNNTKGPFLGYSTCTILHNTQNTVGIVTVYFFLKSTYFKQYNLIISVECHEAGQVLGEFDHKLCNHDGNISHLFINGIRQI